MRMNLVVRDSASNVTPFNVTPQNYSAAFLVPWPLF